MPVRAALGAQKGALGAESLMPGKAALGAHKGALGDQVACLPGVLNVPGAK